MKQLQVRADAVQIGDILFWNGRHQAVEYVAVGPQLVTIWTVDGRENLVGAEHTLLVQRA